MRFFSAVLETSNDEPLLGYVYTKLREDEFVSAGKVFLSTLAAADSRYLDTICSRFLPHKLSFVQPTDSCTPREGLQALQARQLGRPCQAEDGQSRAVLITNDNLSSCLGSTVEPTTAEISGDQDMFAALTTLEDVDADSQSDLHVAVEPIDVWNAIGTDSGKEMTNQVEAATSGLSDPKLHATDSRDTSAASVSHNSADDNAVSLVSSSDLAPPAHNLPRINRRLAPILLQSRSCRALAILTPVYGDKIRHPLTREELEHTVQLGDSLLQADIRSFVDSFCHAWPADGLWNRQPLNKPTHGQTRVEKLFDGVRCAQILKHDSVVDPVRLRMAKIILYHHFERLCIDLPSNKRLRAQLSRGRDRASVATDMIVRAVYDLEHNTQVDEKTLTRYRRCIQKQKSIGKRWCMLANHLGLGVLLVCHPDVEVQINETRFTETKIAALLTYVANAYPWGVAVSHALSPLVRCILRDEPPPFPRLDDAVLATIAEYTQRGERETFEFEDHWRAAEIPKGFIQIL